MNPETLEEVEPAVSEEKALSWPRGYFYRLMTRYLSLFIRPGDSVCEVNPPGAGMAAAFRRFGGEKHAARWRTIRAQAPYDELAEAASEPEPDFVLLMGTLHFERDIQELLAGVRGMIGPSTRVIIVYYSSLWRPLARLATFLGMRSRAPEQNWIANEDVVNLLRLTGYRAVRREQKVLLPLYVPLVSELFNRWIAPLPLVGSASLVNILVARPIELPAAPEPAERPSVSVVVAARNEAGNIDDLLRRCPMMGPADELIIVEGNSTDDTWERLQTAQGDYSGPHELVIAQQDGKGKGDAVRKGFALATKDILMILDADLTVPPEDLPKFYDAIATDKGEFINGSRLVYPMESEAMRFFNLLGNKFFAMAFSLVLGQRFKDTLCGTKVLTRANYEQLAAHRSYFGDFDPFGDFDLIFGAARMGLEIVEVPVRYRERTYGDTNIRRWKHGVILLRMLLFAARKIRFL